MWKVSSTVLFFPGGSERAVITGVWRSGLNSPWYHTETVLKTNGCHLSLEASRTKKNLPHYYL